ncbi:hypothetical protein P154DRAFT_524119 [Amniculicola lignicola CBS 123094]|uniref:Uncharacterized protein n=1 Tax=Amniculicola lignicola CBS 123094 TaxID=1392246 RepID=A0A6A5WBY6_9PLEO|nr:hypothetical protein P154DRAFT_524119 [Amniculicola lignicola CBS 123094]
MLSHPFSHLESNTRRRTIAYSLLPNRHVLAMYVHAYMEYCAYGIMYIIITHMVPQHIHPRPRTCRHLPMYPCPADPLLSSYLDSAIRNQSIDRSDRNSASSRLTSSRLASRLCDG